jgi:hypothetical protein
VSCEVTDLLGMGWQAQIGQESLEKKVALLEAHQKEVHDSLVSMEGLALRMYQVKFHLYPLLCNLQLQILIRSAPTCSPPVSS